MHGSGVTFSCAPHFSVQIRVIHKWDRSTFYVHSLGCAVHHLPYTAQPKGRARLEQVFTFARDRVVEYHVRMLHGDGVALDEFTIGTDTVSTQHHQSSSILKLSAI